MECCHFWYFCSLPSQRRSNQSAKVERLMEKTAKAETVHTSQLARSPPPIPRAETCSRMSVAKGKIPNNP